jgi:hypothetical protein
MPMFKLIAENSNGNRFKVINSVHIKSMVKLGIDLLLAYPHFKFTILDDKNHKIWP